MASYGNGHLTAEAIWGNARANESSYRPYTPPINPLRRCRLETVTCAFVCRDFGKCRKLSDRLIAGHTKTYWIHNGFGSRKSGMSRALVYRDGIGTRQ
jgi:hypothetical protein